MFLLPISSQHLHSCQHIFSVIKSLHNVQEKLPMRTGWEILEVNSNTDVNFYCILIFFSEILPLPALYSIDILVSTQYIDVLIRMSTFMHYIF